jgi:NAD(P)-dependent dehydrogenase (short-subunit alcohol dehydrogenase family)
VSKPSRPPTHPPTLPGGRSVSVLVPVLNEIRNLRATVENLLRALDETVEQFEIIVVDDGSSDGTGDLADELAADQPMLRVIHNGRNMGLGYSYRRGIDAARNQYFVYIPGDNSWPYASFLELFRRIGTADIVTSYAVNPQVRGLVRQTISSQYTKTLNRLFEHRMRYYNGLTVYPLAFLLLNPPTSYYFGFQAELLLRALDQGLSIVEIGLPIDEHSLQRSKAVTARNIVSVAATVAGMYAELRLLPRLQGQRRPPRRWQDARAALQLAQLHAAAPVPLQMPSAWQPDAAVTSGEFVARQIVVAGASSGIGAALVQALARDGHKVYACARRGERLAQVTKNNTIAQSRVCDVSDEEQVVSFLHWVSEQTPHIDAVVNCAGSFGAIGPIESTGSAAWLDTLRVNLFGTFLMIKHAMPLLERSPDARILNFSGGGAFNAFPRYSAYACSKAAVVRLTESLAAELAPRGIAVNAVAPGFIATEIHRATLAAGEERAGPEAFRQTQAMLEDGDGRMTTAVDCIRFLLGEESRGLTGKTISANFDPWPTPEFREQLATITRSDVWTMRRMNIVNLPEDDLKRLLDQVHSRVHARA